MRGYLATVLLELENAATNAAIANKEKTSQSAIATASVV
jgi:hypothetical protein